MITTTSHRAVLKMFLNSLLFVIFYFLWTSLLALALGAFESSLLGAVIRVAFFAVMIKWFWIIANDTKMRLPDKGEYQRTFTPLGQPEAMFRAIVCICVAVLSLWFTLALTIGVLRVSHNLLDTIVFATNWFACTWLMAGVFRVQLFGKNLLPNPIDLESH